MKEILLYNLDNEKGKQIRRVCSPLSISCRDILPAEYLETIGALASLPGFMRRNLPVSVPAFSDEMMLFCGFTNDDIYTFLSQCKAAGIAPVALKATLTPNNVQWNSLELHAELCNERAALKQ